jgi:ATP-dependent DNA helicase RecQ
MREAAKPTRRSKADRQASRDARSAVKAGFQGDGAKLFEALRNWRRDTAQTQGVPPYVIFHDATLAAIVTSRPGDLADVARVPGIGEAKLKKYGAELLAVVLAGC